MDPVGRVRFIRGIALASMAFQAAGLTHYERLEPRRLRRPVMQPVRVSARAPEVASMALALAAHWRRPRPT